MRKKLAFILALSNMLLCLAACNDTEDTVATDRASTELYTAGALVNKLESENSYDLNMIDENQTKEYTFKEYLNSKSVLILYEDNVGQHPAKDSAPIGFYIIKNHKVSYYNGTQDMNDANLEVEKKRNEMTSQNIFSTEYSKAEREYNKAKEEHETIKEKYTEDFSYGKLSKMSDEEIILLIKSQLVAEYENADYNIAVFTDSSGNRTINEEVIIDEHKLVHSADGWKGLTYEDVGKPEKEKDVLSFNDKGRSSGFDNADVYESHYSELCNYCWERISENEKDILIDFDSPESKDIIVDPKQ